MIKASVLKNICVERNGALVIVRNDELRQKLLNKEAEGANTKPKKIQPTELTEEEYEHYFDLGAVKRIKGASNERTRPAKHNP